MRLSQLEDKNLDQNNIQEQQLRLAKKTSALYLNNLAFKKLPEKILSFTFLKILDLSHNNIINIPDQISEFQNLEQLYLNNNPLIAVPMSIQECKKLQIINLSYTFVKKLPREMANLQKLYILDLTNCPIQGKMKENYEIGISYVQQYFRRKLDRLYYKKLITKNLKDYFYVSDSYDSIIAVIQKVFDDMKEVETKDLKRLVRNMNNIFPLKLSDVDSNKIKHKLFSHLVEIKDSTVKSSKQKKQEEQDKIKRQLQKQQEEEQERQRLEEEQRQKELEAQLLKEQEELKKKEEEERLKAEEEAKIQEEKNKKAQKKATIKK